MVRPDCSQKFFAVWTALAWDLAVLTKEHFAKIPFTTIATALDLLRRSTRQERLQKKQAEMQSFGTPTLLDSVEDDPLPSETEYEAALEDARFVRALRQHERHTWLYASFLLATKVEETLISFTALKRALANKFPTGTPYAVNLVMREQRILTLIGFAIVVRTPHLEFLSIGLDIPQAVRDQALHFLNVAIFTSAISIFRPVAMAAAALYHAVAVSSLPATDPLRSTQWWSELLNVSFYEIAEISTQLVPAAISLLGLTGLEEPQLPAGSPVEVQRRPIVPCRPRSEFNKLSTINKGTFGTVYRAQDRYVPGVDIALKKLHSTYPANDGHGGFPYYMIREILYLILLKHPHIIHGLAMAVKEVDGRPPIFYIVMEFVECDLLRILQEQLKIEEKRGPGGAPGPNLRFRLSQVKNLLLQLLDAIDYMHSQHLLHRDLKCANLLLTKGGVLKVADLGSIRDADRRTINMTVQVITLWYRPPELICEVSKYDSAVDIWSIGCLFYELLTYKPLFPGKTESDTMRYIIRAKGMPEEPVFSRLYKDLPMIKSPPIQEVWAANKAPKPIANAVYRYCPNLSPEGADLFSRMLEWDPERRITAKEALSHPFFTQEPLPEPAIPDESLFPPI